VNDRPAETAGTIASLGVTDILILLSFRQIKWCDRHTWRKFQSGSWRYSRCDYILAETHSSSVHKRSPLGKRRSHLGRTSHQPGYEKSRRRCPLHIAPAARTDTDKLIQDLKERFVTPRNSWISPKTWELIDRKALVRRAGAYGLLMVPQDDRTTGRPDDRTTAQTDT
jgi:hypothetical protein